MSKYAIRVSSTIETAIDMVKTSMRDSRVQPDGSVLTGEEELGDLLDFVTEKVVKLQEPWTSHSEVLASWTLGAMKKNPKLFIKAGEITLGDLEVEPMSEDLMEEWLIQWLRHYLALELDLPA